MLTYMKINKKINYEFKLDKRYALILSFLVGAIGLYFYKPISSRVVLETLINLSLFVTLLNVSLIDIELYIIPDTYNILVIVLGLLNIAFIKTHYLFLIMAVISFLLFFAINLLSRGALGMGDVKLSLGLGLFLDLAYFGKFLTYSFGAGAIIGLILILLKKKSKDDRIPFGPFMAIGFAIALLA